MDYFLLVVGLAVLILGGDFLVKGAVGIAVKAKVSTLVIAMTVVSFGTSAPELLVSISAAFEEGEANHMSIGNVIGSNIANLSLVLGITALVSSIPVDRNSIRQDWPMMLFASILFVLVMLDFQIVRWEGIVLFSILIVFTIYMILKSRKQSSLVQNIDVDIPDEKELTPSWKSLLFIAGGVLGLYFGSEWLLTGAKNIATSFGVSPYIISVTIVAFGTSVPELVTSAVAAYRKEADIAVGNLIGSNIFNILSVIGITSIITDVKLPESVLYNDAIWMMGIVLLILPMMLGKRIIQRWHGLILVAYYLTYVVLLVK
jgi:cation:H+ antiporter